MGFLMTKEQAYKKAVLELFEICDAMVFEFNNPDAQIDIDKCRKALLEDLMGVQK